MLGRLMESRRSARGRRHARQEHNHGHGGRNPAPSAGFDPTVVYGAAPIVGTPAGVSARGRWMLAEACEYHANFRQLKPQIAVILGIEPDHFDCFATPAELEAAFAGFAATGARGWVGAGRAPIARPRVRSTAPATARPRRSVWRRRPAWQATELRERHGFYSFQIRCRERLVTEVKLHVPGRHNVLNALAAAALASHCGATGTAIRTGLERFAGLRRRLQLLGEVARSRFWTTMPTIPPRSPPRWRPCGKCIPAAGCGAFFSRIRPRERSTCWTNSPPACRMPIKSSWPISFRAREASAGPARSRAGRPGPARSRRGADVLQLATRRPKSTII